MEESVTDPPSRRGAHRGRTGAGDARELVAPAKLTLSLRVLGRRPDGYHEIEAEMVTVDLHDVVSIRPGPCRIEILGTEGTRAETLPSGPENIVSRALSAVGRRASVTLRKRIPVGGGLGGGSADAAAILRWAGVDDPDVAASLGADVPFCVHGGRALVRGIGERISPLPFVDRRFVLLVPPFKVDTASVYRAWDARAGRADGSRSGPAQRGHANNDLLTAAVATAPALERWGAHFAELTGRTPALAGSGSSWWVEGTPDEFGLSGRDALSLDRERGRLIAVKTVPESWQGGEGG